MFKLIALALINSIIRLTRVIFLISPWPFDPSILRLDCLYIVIALSNCLLKTAYGIIRIDLKNWKYYLLFYSFRYGTRLARRDSALWRRCTIGTPTRPCWCSTSHSTTVSLRSSVGWRNCSRTWRRRWCWPWSVTSPTWRISGKSMVRRVKSTPRRSVLRIMRFQCCITRGLRPFSWLSLRVYWEWHRTIKTRSPLSRFPIRIAFLTPTACRSRLPSRRARKTLVLRMAYSRSRSLAAKF